MFKLGNDKTFLDACWESSLLSADLIDTIKIDYDSDYDKQYLVGESYQVFEIAAECATELYEISGDGKYLNELFALMERSKAVALMDALRSTKAFHFAGVPELLLEREKALRYAIREFTDRIPEYASASSVEWMNFLETKKSYAELIDGFKSEYPRYHQLKHATSVANSLQISKYLSENEALIEYLVGERHIIIYLIRTDTIVVKRVPVDFPLEGWISSFRKAVSFPGKSIDPVLFDCGSVLYQKLISPISTFLQGYDRLIIIPDGIVGYLPFDALIAGRSLEDNDQHDFNYLINHFEICYAYSATFLLEQEKSQLLPGNNQILAFAPFDRSGLVTMTPLYHTREEVKKIRNTIGGRSYINSRASLPRFIKKAKDYRFLHFATHAILDDDESENSYLAFAATKGLNKPGRLLVRDLYNLNLNAELAVLSACETGLGNVHRGEGIISLAHGFSFAGVKSLVTTLWKVNDRATSQIMIHFYNYMMSGFSKSTALRRAKLDFLAAAKSDMTHPYFWAAFVPYGDMDAIEILTVRPYRPWVLSLIILVFVLFLWRKKIWCR